MDEILKRKIDVENYLIYSTVISVFLIIRIARTSIDVFAGYPVVILNSALLLVLGRLAIHRNHAIIIALVAAISLVASRSAPTPVTSIIAQITGISILSVYFFSVLTTAGLTVPHWMKLYAHIALYLAVYGIVENVTLHRFMHYDPEGEQRLKSIFAEPSLFVYTTLPAIGYFINAWHSERRYGWETLIFLAAYVLADSSLGYFGLLLIAAFTYIKKLSIWHLLAALVAGALVVTGLFFASGNFRLRVTDTAIAISKQNLKSTNGSTFAMLSNIYVAASAFRDHPVIGVGIGGYVNAYSTYIHDLGEEQLSGVQYGLNMDDANSLFVRAAAELGSVGLIAIFAFLSICARVEGKPYRQIRNALLPYMIVRMSRFGAYFSMELYFFVGLYVLNYLEYRRSLAQTEPRSSQDSAGDHGLTPVTP